MSVVALPSGIPKLVRLLASDVDGEVLAAAHALKRKLNSAGLDFNDLAARIENPPEREVRTVYRGSRPHPPGSVLSWRDLSRSGQLGWLGAIRRQEWLSPWEKSFSADLYVTVSSSSSPRLSAKQIDILNKLLTEAQTRGVRP